MRDDERRALEAVSFDWAPTPARVWKPPEAHVDGLSEHVYRLITAAFREAARVEEESPLGIVVEGEPGSGKTHLLAWTRGHVQDQGGYFLLAGLTRGREFWPDIVHTFIQDLTRTSEPGTSTQLRLMLERLADRAGVDPETRERVTGRIALTPSALNGFEQAVRRLLPGSGRAVAAVLRAMTMMAADDADLRDIGRWFPRRCGWPAAGDAAARPVR
jgi:hypothetical protein